MCYPGELYTLLSFIKIINIPKMVYIYSLNPEAPCAPAAGTGTLSAAPAPQQSGCFYNLGLRTQKSHLTVVSQPGASS